MSDQCAKEGIPDGDVLFRFWPRRWMKGKKGKEKSVSPSFFGHSFYPDRDEYQRELSCDWEKYSTWEESIERSNTSETDGAVQLSVAFAREQMQDVEHVPEPDNCAHSHIIGDRDEEVQRAFARHAVILKMPVPQDV